MGNEMGNQNVNESMQDDPHGEEGLSDTQLVLNINGLKTSMQDGPHEEDDFESSDTSNPLNDADGLRSLSPSVSPLEAEDLKGNHINSYDSFPSGTDDSQIQKEASNPKALVQESPESKDTNESSDAPVVSKNLDAVGSPNLSVSRVEVDNLDEEDTTLPADNNPSRTDDPQTQNETSNLSDPIQENPEEGKDANRLRDSAAAMTNVEAKSLDENHTGFPDNYPSEAYGSQFQNQASYQKVEEERRMPDKELADVEPKQQRGISIPHVESPAEDTPEESDEKGDIYEDAIDESSDECVSISSLSGPANIENNSLIEDKTCHENIDLIQSNTNGKENEGNELEEHNVADLVSDESMQKYNENVLSSESMNSFYLDAIDLQIKRACLEDGAEDVATIPMAESDKSENQPAIVEKSTEICLLEDEVANNSMDGLTTIVPLTSPTHVVEQTNGCHHLEDNMAKVAFSVCEDNNERENGCGMELDLTPNSTYENHTAEFKTEDMPEISGTCAEITDSFCLPEELKEKNDARTETVAEGEDKTVLHSECELLEENETSGKETNELALPLSEDDDKEDKEEMNVRLVEQNESQQKIDSLEQIVGITCNHLEEQKLEQMDGGILDSHLKEHDPEIDALVDKQLTDVQMIETGTSDSLHMDISYLLASVQESPAKNIYESWEDPTVSNEADILKSLSLPADVEVEAENLGEKLPSSLDYSLSEIHDPQIQNPASQQSDSMQENLDAKDHNLTVVWNIEDNLISLSGVTSSVEDGILYEDYVSSPDSSPAMLSDPQAKTQASDQRDLESDEQKSIAMSHEELPAEPIPESDEKVDQFEDAISEVSNLCILPNALPELANNGKKSSADENGYDERVVVDESDVNGKENERDGEKEHSNLEQLVEESESDEKVDQFEDAISEVSNLCILPNALPELANNGKKISADENGYDERVVVDESDVNGKENERDGEKEHSNLEQLVEKESEPIHIEDDLSTESLNSIYLDVIDLQIKMDCREDGTKVDEIPEAESDNHEKQPSFIDRTGNCLSDEEVNLNVMGGIDIDVTGSSPIYEVKQENEGGQSQVKMMEAACNGLEGNETENGSSEGVDINDMGDPNATFLMGSSSPEMKQEDECNQSEENVIKGVFQAWQETETNGSGPDLINKEIYSDESEEEQDMIEISCSCTEIIAPNCTPENTDSHIEIMAEDEQIWQGKEFARDEFQSDMKEEAITAFSLASLNGDQKTGGDEMIGITEVSDEIQEKIEERLAQSDDVSDDDLKGQSLEQMHGMSEENNLANLVPERDALPVPEKQSADVEVGEARIQDFLLVDISEEVKDLIPTESFVSVQLPEPKQWHALVEDSDVLGNKEISQTSETGDTSLVKEVECTEIDHDGISGSENNLDIKIRETTSGSTSVRNTMAENEALGTQSQNENPLQIQPPKVTESVRSLVSVFESCGAGAEENMVEKPIITGSESETSETTTQSDALSSENCDSNTAEKDVEVDSVVTAKPKDSPAHEGRAIELNQCPLPEEEIYGESAAPPLERTEGVHVSEPPERKEENDLNKKNMEEECKPSPAKESMDTPPTRRKQKPRYSLFSNCMCCTTVIQ